MTILTPQNNRKRTEKVMLCVSLVIAVWLTFATYPGVFYSDSHARWVLAKELLTRAAEGSLSEYQTYLSHAPQFVFAGLYLLTANPAVYTLIQCFLLYYTTYLLFWRFIAPGRLLPVVLLTVFPSMWGYAVYHEMSVATLIGFNGILLLVLDENRADWQNTAPRSKILYCAALFLSCYALFGFRQNSVTLLPVVILFSILYLKKADSRRLIPVISTLAATLAIIFLLPGLLGFSQKYDASRPGMVWESVSTINSMSPDKRAEYSTYFDDIFGPGVTEAMLSQNAANNNSINPIWSACDIFVMGSPENKGPVLNKYLELFKREPDIFIRNKWNFILRSLGFPESLPEAEYSFNFAGIMERYGFSNTAQRSIFFKTYDGYTRCSSILRTPLILYLVSLALVIAEKIFKIPPHGINLGLFLFLSAAFYYGAFLINNQSFEFRYFYPAMMMLLFGITHSVYTIAAAVAAKTKENNK